MEVKSLAAAPAARAPRRSSSTRGAGAVQERARRFAEEVLMPLEEEAERRGGRLPDGRRRRREARGRSRPACTAACTPASTAGRAGPGSSGRWSRSSTAGPPTRSTGTCRTRTTSGPTPAPSRSTATCGRRFAASSRTPTRSPSATPARTRRRSRPTAERTDAGFRLNAEKWFVTAGDVAAVYVVMANVIDGGERLPTLFVVDRDRAGRRDRRRPGLHPQLSGGPSDDPLHATSRSPRTT